MYSRGGKSNVLVSSSLQNKDDDDDDDHDIIEAFGQHHLGLNPHYTHYN